MNGNALSVASALKFAAFFLLAILSPVVAQGPNDPNEGSRIQYDQNTGAATFSWWGQPGVGYFLQQSDDLTTWQYVPTLELGTDSLLSYGFTTTSDRFFLRLQAEPNPFGTDSAGGGLFDGYHFLSGIAPNSGNLTYLQLWLQNHLPSANGHPARLPNLTNVANPPTYVTPIPGGGDIGPQLDDNHKISMTSNPTPLSPWAFGNTTVTLTWFDQYADQQLSIDIQRRDGSGAWSTLATLQGGSLHDSFNNGTYEDHGLLANVSYLYRLLVRYKSGLVLQSYLAPYTVPVIAAEYLRQKNAGMFNPGFEQFTTQPQPPLHYAVRTKSMSFSSDSEGSESSSGLSIRSRRSIRALGISSMKGLQRSQREVIPLRRPWPRMVRGAVLLLIHWT